MAIYNPGSEFRGGSGYGPRNAPVPGASTFHRGEDFPAPIGTSIPVAADGTVYYSGNLSGYGNVIVFKHEINGETIYTLYAHLDQQSPLKSGDIVHQGDEVGVSGNSGRGSGPHLHFDIIAMSLAN